MSAAGTMTPEDALAGLADGERSEPDRIALARHLGEHGTLAEIQPMFAILERAESGLGLEIAAALRKLGAWSLFARELKTGGDPRRERAAMALARIADPRAEEALAAALADESDRVRKQVVQALARLAGDGPTASLARALGDASPEVRWLAADALRRRGAAGAHRAALEAALEREDDDLTREAIERALR